MTRELISHHLCPFVQRAAIVLSEKNVAFDRIDIDLSAKPDWFLAISPLGKTPVLRVDGQHVIFESAVICEYLDETKEPRLHPADPLARARHRAWIEFASATAADVGGLSMASDEQAFDRKRDDLAAKFAQLELDHEPYFAGADFSLVDAAFAPMFRYFDTFDVVVNLHVFDSRPKTLAWRQALADRPSVKGAVGAADADKLRESLVERKSYLGGLTSRPRD